MFDRFDDRTLEIATVVVVVIIALVILCYLAIYLNPQVFFNPFKPPTPTAMAVAGETTIVGPTWTSTPTPTHTNTPRPTSTWTPTSTPTPTNTPTPTWTPTATATNTPPPPTATRKPKPKPPTATPTPWPYYWVPCDQAGSGCPYETATRPDCNSTWVHGWVVAANGLGEPNVQVRVGNDQGWYQDISTDIGGYYVFQFAQGPVAGNFWVRVFKGGQPRSQKFAWSTSAGCVGPFAVQEMVVVWRHR